MPTVPRYDSPTVAPGGAVDNQLSPLASVSRLDAPDTQNFAADQAQKTGQALQQFGGDVGKIALDMQEQVNQVRVNDAVNKARQAAQDLAYNPQSGYLNLKGDAALTRPDGQDLPTEYGQKLQDQLGQISDSLGNDMQRRQFQINAADLQAQFHGQVESHMLSEFRDHALSVNDGTINLASDDAKRNWNNPDVITPSLNAAKAAVVEKGRISGWSASQTDAALLATTSKVHSDVVMSALENNNPNYAMGYLNRYKDQMTADDILRVQGHVNQNVWMGQALGAVQVTTTKLTPAISPNNFDRMAQITAQSESGNKDLNPDGTPVVSSAGAKYKMQVLPSTAANPGFGIAPAANDSPDEYNRVGSQYLQALVQKYGNADKAWAAYNAGPGALEAAIKKADQSVALNKNDSTVQLHPWLDFMPKDTQDYVTKNMTALNSNASVVPRPTEMEFVNTALQQLPEGSPPQLVKMTREQATQQFTMLNKSLDEQGDNAVRQAQQWIAQNNGNFDGMPPSLRDAVTRLAPGKVDDLIKYARVFDKGENATNLVLYNRLASHPDELGSMSDTQFEMLKSQLSQTDFKHFANERSNYINGTTDESAGAINSKALNQSLNSRLESLGLPSKPDYKNPQSDVNKQLGARQQFVRDSIYAAQQQAGKKFTPAEIDQHLDNLFMKSDTFKGLLWDTTKPLMSVNIGDIRDTDKNAIKAAFVARGVTNPTDDQILRAYWTKKNAAK